MSKFHCSKFDDLEISIKVTRHFCIKVTLQASQFDSTCKKCHDFGVLTLNDFEMILKVIAKYPTNFTMKFVSNKP